MSEESTEITIIRRELYLEFQAYLTALTKASPNETTKHSARIRFLLDEADFAATQGEIAQDDWISVRWLRARGITEGQLWHKKRLFKDGKPGGCVFRHVSHRGHKGRAFDEVLFSSLPDDWRNRLLQ